MNFISENIDKLPAVIAFPLAFILVSLPILKLLVIIRNDNRSHSRELLQQIVLHLEKYAQDQNKVSSFFIEEAARSIYGAPLLLSEILYFINKSGASHELHNYAAHKPYLEIKEEKICLLNPASKIYRFKMLDFTWKELKGYAFYFVYCSFGAMLIMVDISPPVVWTILKWLLIIFFITTAATILINTFKMRDARKYVEGIDITQHSTENL